MLKFRFAVTSIFRFFLNMHEQTNGHDLLLENKSLREELHSTTQTKNELLISQQQLDAILDNAPVEVCLKDRKGRYIRVNKQYEKIRGVKNEELVGLLPADIFDSNVSTTKRDHDLSILNSGKAELREEKIRFASDKQSRTLLTSKFPVFNADGEVDGLGAIVTDVTANLATKEKLRKSNVLFSQAESMGNIGHWSWDLVADKLISCSPEFARIFGMTVPEALNYFISTEAKVNLIHSGDKEYFRQCKLDTKGLPAKSGIEYRIITALGDTRHVHTFNEIVLDNEGAPTQSFGTVQDITDRKKSVLWDKSRNHVLELIANDESLPLILESIVRVIEQEDKSMLCSILLLDDSGKHLLVGAAPSLPEFYNNAIDGIDIGMRHGSCGTAAFINERIIVEDIQTHPHWAPYKKLARKAKLAACWSEPIRATNGDVLGTFAIYHNKAHYPTEANFMALAQTADLASIAIEKKQAALKLKSSENRLRLALAVTKHAWFDLNVQTGEVLTSPEYSILLGYDSSKFRSDLQGWQDSLHPDDHNRVMATYRECLSQCSEFSIDYRRSAKSGGWLWFNTTGEITEWSSSQQPLRMIGIHADITERKQAEDKLERMAHYDLLTDLPNRVLLADRLSQAMVQCQQRNQSLAVAYLDLDGFKAVNDTHGHAAGDQLLVVVSQRMKAALQEGDTLARIGGDEFIVVLTNLDSIKDSKQVLDRLLKAVSDPVKVDHAVMRVSASIGVTLYPQDGANADQLTRHADQAMYIAKQAGKNRYHLFDADHNNAINIQRKKINAIRSALKRREFFLHYQPKVNMFTGDVIGVEALIRWQHPDRGLVQPLEFLPIIEGHAFSLEVGEWVIGTALAQINQWQSMAINLPISVNISAYQLQQDNFPTRLATLLAAHPEVDPCSLELEILETSELSDINRVSATMDACHALGVRFALDDFGTGYSSLTHLRRLPAYLIKVDQSFVRDMLVDDDDLAIIEGVVALAKTFRREVIAEGVETIAHGEALLRLGCNLAQGYGIARPMPASNIPQWLSSWKVDDAWQEPNIIFS